MKRERNLVSTVLACLLMQACASGLEPQSSDSPPPDAAPMEEKSVDSGQLQVRSGERGAELDAEIIRYEEYDEYQSIELNVPIESDQVDQGEVMTPSGEMFPRSRQEQIVHDYETDNVGIKIPANKSGNLGFRLKLIDDEQWPPGPQR